MNLPETKRRTASQPRPDRRGQIQQMAMEVFAKKGFPQSSLQDIADELGIKRESIYYYFKSKKEILLSMILEPSRIMLAKAVAIENSEASPLEQLKGVLRLHLDHFTPSYLEISVSLREKNLLEDEEFLELKTQWKQYERVWTSIIKKGQEDGSFNQSLDAKIVAYGILGMCNWLSRWYKSDGDSSIDSIMDNFYTLCTQGIFPAQPAN